MSQFNSEFGVFQVWLGHFLTTAQMYDADRVFQFERCHQRFHYPYTVFGQRGFLPLDTLAQQAFCQKLAHRGCIPSLLLLGHSLSTDYGDSKRVICDVSGYQYAFLGIEGILLHSTDPGFWQESQLFLETPQLYQICSYLQRKWQPLGLNHGNHPVIEFCEMLTEGCAFSMQLDS